MKFLYKNSSLINDTEIASLSQILKPYIAHLQSVADKRQNDEKKYEDPESSLNLPFDTTLLQKVNQMKIDKTTPELKYIIDIGIGGSNLGTKAIYDAIFGFFDALEPSRFPKMIFLDTVNEEFLTKFSALIETLENKNQVIVNAISKSGGTTETIANLEVVMAILEKKFGDMKDRVVITTDENSKLWQIAMQKGFDLLPIPKQVGGRFSVFSAVGLFPLSMCGLDIDSLRLGASDVLKTCLNPDIENNPAALSAMIIFSHYKQGKNIHDTFLYLPQLESIGKWYRQLMGESLGKEHDLQGNVVHAGITPTVSIGSTDLHSVGQLYLGGPHDKITTFVYTKSVVDDVHAHVRVPVDVRFPLVAGIAGKKFSEILTAIREGVKIAYQKQGLPYMEVVLGAGEEKSVDTQSFNERSLGQFLQFKMIEMMYLGKLLNVNAFDQPHVELYKMETKRILNEL